MEQESLPIYTRFAQIYDEAYHFVDYEKSAAYLTEEIRAKRPNASSLLEVACGTGRYLELLARGFEVEGLDRSPEMLLKARTRLPAVKLHQGDMAEFALNRQFDVVCCLFRSIGYVQTRDRLHLAVASMAHHLTPNGLLLVEPFFTPETYWVNDIKVNEFRRGDLAIAWMYVSERSEKCAVLRIHCLVGTPAGVKHFVEVHEFGLFTRDDFARAFASAGLQLDYDSSSPGGTGMYIGYRAQGALPHSY